MKKKWLLGLLSGLCVATCALGFASCDKPSGDGGNGGSEPTEIEAVYAEYVEYAEAKGQQPLSYEDWLASIKGQDGKDGVDGKSAYQIWLDNGHTGDEEDFLNWLKGDDAQVEEGTPGLHYQRISGKDEYSLIGLGTASELNIVIATTYNGLPVTEFGKNAFPGAIFISEQTIIPLEAQGIESVTIPSSIINIDSPAFSYCIGLTAIYCEATSKPSGWCSNWNDSVSGVAYWYSETEPTTEGNYWRYVDGVPTKW